MEASNKSILFCTAPSDPSLTDPCGFPQVGGCICTRVFLDFSLQSASGPQNRSDLVHDPRGVELTGQTELTPDDAVSVNIAPGMSALWLPRGGGPHLSQLRAGSEHLLSVSCSAAAGLMLRWCRRRPLQGRRRAAQSSDLADNKPPFLQRNTTRFLPVLT